MTNPLAIISRYTLRPVTADDSFRDLGLNDVDAAGIAHWLEIEFNIDIPDHDIERWTCVADIVRTAERVRG